MKKKFKPCNPLKTTFSLITTFLLCSFFYFNYGDLSRFIVPSGQVIGFADPGSSNSFVPSPPPEESLRLENEDSLKDSEETDCDIFDGKWVWDETYPLYDSKNCLFIENGFRCSENGRPDLSYTKWRWQPNNCNLPRFDTKVTLEKLRNKRVVFVGDSLGRTQWESFLCMLSSAVPSNSSTYEVNGNPITKRQPFLVFKFQSHNCTVEYYKASFLVNEVIAPPGAPKRARRILKLDQLLPISNKWKDADLLIFNSGHWWTPRKTLKSGVFFQEGGEMRMNMSVESAFERAMETLLGWVDREVNLSKTHVFFRTYAPYHFFSDGVSVDNINGNCDLESLPNLRLPFSPGSWPHYKIASDVLSRRWSSSQMAMIFNILNVTYLTGQRKDGHCALYNHNMVRDPKSQKAPRRYREDCLHWCLPGVPDTWNELLYAHLLRKEHSGLSNSSSSS